MSSDPRYIVLAKEQFEGIHQDGLEPLPLVVVGPALPDPDSAVDPAIHLAIELAGAHLSAINSGLLDPVQMLEAMYHVGGYLDRLSEMVIMETLEKFGDTGGPAILAAQPSSLKWENGCQPLMIA